MELDQNDLGRVPTKVVAEMVKQADGSVRATWHDENFREYIEGKPPAVIADDGELVRVNMPDLLYRYAANLYRRSQVYGVLPD